MKQLNKRQNLLTEKEFLNDYLSVLREEVNARYIKLHKKINKQYNNLKNTKNEEFQNKLRQMRRKHKNELSQLKKNWDSDIEKINSTINKDLKTELTTHLLISKDIEEEDESSELSFNLSQKIYIQKKNAINQEYMKKFQACYARHVEENQNLLSDFKADLLLKRSQYNAAITSILEQRKRDISDAQIRFVEVVSESDFDAETKINLIEAYTNLRDQIEEAVTKDRTSITYSFGF
ncbi:hypothetical protein TVAG_019810 [Trichomonas vaginalis G3]|uniref:Uncharacterized protein n=1 Tax=Trichomonas vaginalis (strain ATCC PRA-98 / G3) TaxID=412133 RepID=A2DX53_TRIV3|nr:hypothetical protein TVAGG3_0185990 [Trichomonas vaginalis G3]EAY15080.1 hypothetical protein TVAG_019810 [Trichomonas vaginalis G3]KAI5549646.1 hypothetical protein TVAGG3_0185990 [Trichomonas vaginalis G3]|eukprot:XP_001327303.1 hypothetical protein [Trichomonas vaginalis G3]